MRETILETPVKYDKFSTFFGYSCEDKTPKITGKN